MAGDTPCTPKFVIGLWYRVKKLLPKISIKTSSIPGKYSQLDLAKQTRESSKANHCANFAAYKELL